MRQVFLMAIISANGLGHYTNFIVSLVVSILTAAYFIYGQRKFHKSTMENLSTFQKFFKKKGDYETIESDGITADPGKRNNSSKRLKNVADEDAELYDLIEDINDYLQSCKGTATFNIIQNKTERRVTKLYDKASSKSSFPTHYGLMGTFVGVFLGLGAFLVISLKSPDGITDDAIHSLILGVLVSMSTSFIGLRMSTKANNLISDAKNKNDDDKNEFYEYIQNKLMPSVDISLTEALGNLHQTVSDFEPSFTHVIEGFKSTFRDCTTAFGDDFRNSVRTMVDAVGTMSSNINEISQNVNLLEELLNRLTGAEWITYMRFFADAADRFKTLTKSLDDFERARRMMLAACQESINMQKSYNDSLTIPREVASNINTILQRVVRFEQNINALGEQLATTQMVGNTTIEEIQNQIKAIKAKHKIAEQYIETSNNKLEMFFDSQLIELKRLEAKYQEALVKLFEAYEKITEEHQEEINKRHEIFKGAIDEKFELSEVRSELSHLKKIPGLENKTDELKNGQDSLINESKKIQSGINTIRSDIKNGLKEGKDNKKNESKASSTSRKNIDEATNQRIAEIQKQREDYQRQLEKINNDRHVNNDNQNPPGNNKTEELPKPDDSENENKENGLLPRIGRFFGLGKKKKE